MCGVLGLPDSDILRWCRHSTASFCPASQMQERVQILHGIPTGCRAAILCYFWFRLQQLEPKTCRSIRFIMASFRTSSLPLSSEGRSSINPTRASIKHRMKNKIKMRYIITKQIITLFPFEPSALCLFLHFSSLLRSCFSWTPLLVLAFQQIPAVPTNSGRAHTHTHTRQEWIIIWIRQELNPETCRLDMKQRK